MVHINTINLWKPHWKLCCDTDREMAATTRQAVLSKIAGDRTLMFAYHFPYRGLGHLRKCDRGGFDLQPVNWQFES